MIAEDGLCSRATATLDARAGAENEHEPVLMYGTRRDAWTDRRRLPAAIAEDASRVCEIGAGAKPTLPPRPGLTLLDISEDELAKAPGGYQTVVADACCPTLDPPGEFDFVFSTSTVEHIPDPRTFHRNVRRMLAPGGLALHYFPTLYAPPFVANRLMPDGLSERLLVTVDPRRRPDGQRAKFKAYYRWCRGPSMTQIGRFASCGFKVEEYRAYFGHRYWQRLGLPRLPALTGWQTEHPVPLLTSFALVILRAI